MLIFLRCIYFDFLEMLPRSHDGNLRFTVRIVRRPARCKVSHDSGALGSALPAPPSDLQPVPEPSSVCRLHSL